MRLLLAEDEQDMSSVLVPVLEHKGYDVDAVANGKEAVDMASKRTYDCMIFDVMMPVMDGLTALREIRETGNTTPVIMLTAKSQIDDRVNGLDSGADDYVTKPFSIAELMARIRSLTRRENSFTPTALTAGNVSLDLEEQELSSQNSIRLGGKETQLMKLLMMNQGKAIDTNYLFSHVWAHEPDVDESIVWIYISYLREKLMSIHGDVRIEGENGGPYTLVPSGED
jgi:DNA-binding response OmpR family regulator